MGEIPGFLFKRIFVCLIKKCFCGLVIFIFRVLKQIQESLLLGTFLEMKSKAPVKTHRVLLFSERLLPY